VLPAELGQLGPGAVVAHTHVVDDPFGLLVPAPQLLLLVAAAVDLVVGELPAGVRLPVWRVGLQVGRPGDAAPEPTRPDGVADHGRVEGGVEQVLQVIKVVPEEVTVAEQVLHQRGPGPPTAEFSRQ
jgi:hypothetical protein